MSVWKFLLLVAGATLARGVVFFLGVGACFWFIKGPSGTLDEAVSKVRDHRAEIGKILTIAKADSDLGWVEPTMDIRTLADNNTKITPTSTRDYETIAAWMRMARFRDLEIERELPMHKLKRIRFVVFDYGWFGSTPPVLAEWSADGKVPWHQFNERCKRANDGWYVCEEDT